MLGSTSLRGVLSVFLCSCVAVCAAAPNSVSVIDRNLLCSVWVPEYPIDGKLVSGTNERFTMQTTVRLWVPGPGGDPPAYEGTTPWEEARLLRVELRFSDLSHDYPPPAPPGDLMWTMAEPTIPPILYRCRYATTHFLDNTELSIRVRGVFLLKRAGEADKQVETTWADCKPKTYNKLLRQATSLPPGPVHISVPEVSMRAAVAASNQIGTGMNHADITVVSPDALAKADILTKLGTSTVFFAYTHGMSTGFFDALNMTGTSGFMNWSDISTATDRASTIPGHNFAFLYSCRTLAPPGDSSAGLSFRVAAISGQPIIVDKAYFGFPEDVVTTVVESGYEPSTPFWTWEYTLDLHAGYFLKRLKQGDTVAIALEAANVAYKPHTPDVSVPGTLARECPMQFRGDPMSRLFYVYLTELERTGMTSSEVDRWYYLK